MAFKSLIGATCACLTVVSINVSATIITHGGLTSNDDGSTNIISDSLNGYEWLRFDVLNGLTRAETDSVLDTQDGGSWKIAGDDEAHMFIIDHTDSYSIGGVNEDKPITSLLYRIVPEPSIIWLLGLGLGLIGLARRKA